jgi:hypothetical protein
MSQIGFNKSESGLLVPSSRLLVGGKYHGQIVRDGWVIEEFEDHNLVVNEGLNALLNIMFNGSTQITTWYLGIFEGNYTPVATVTAATIASASTESTAYTSATRPEYVEAAASSQSITNSANRASFVFNATKTIYGAFLISNATKSGTSGTLFSAARFSSSKAVESGDELLLTYTFTASSV